MQELGRPGATLDEVLAEYLLAVEAARDAGLPTPARHELLARYPDLAQELEAFLRKAGALRAAGGSLEGVPN